MVLLDIVLPNTNTPMFTKVKTYFNNDKVLIYNNCLTLCILLETNENINTVRNHINNKFSMKCKCYVAKKHESKIIIGNNGNFSILYNTLYTNEELFEKYSFNNIGGLMNLESIGLYKCDYPDDQDVDNIISSYDDIPLTFSGMSKNTAKYNVQRSSDVVRYIEVITVNGSEEVFEVVIRIGGANVYTQIYNTNYVKIKPFIYGIPLIALACDDTEVYITGNNENIKVSGNFLYLARNERSNVARTDYTFNDSNRICDGHFYKNDDIIITPMFGSTTISLTEQSSEYLCNYPSDPDINNIKCGQKTVKEYGICSPHGIHKYEIAMEVNIISHFIIYGKAKSVRLEIGGQFMTSQVLNPSNNIHSFKPFSFGIPYTRYHMTTIEIESDLGERITVESVRIVLNNDDTIRIFLSETLNGRGGGLKT